MTLTQAMEEVRKGRCSEEAHLILTAAVAEHPYSPVLHALLAKSAHDTGDAGYDRILRTAAIHVQSRKQLHQFVTASWPADVDAGVVQAEQNTESSAEDLDQAMPDESSAQELKSSQLPEDRVEEFDRLLLAEALGAGAALDLLTHAEEEGTTAPTDAQEVDDRPDANPSSAATISEPGQAETTQDGDIAEAAKAVEAESSAPVVPEQAPLSDTEVSIEEHKPLVVRDRMSFSRWMEVLEEPESRDGDSAGGSHPTRDQSFTDLEIIDHFIENEASLVPKRAEFFSPVKAARNSLVDRDDIVSETLAGVYAAQGNVSKAIATYEKLSLLYPEKSTYFAALIEKLKRD